MSPHFYIVYRIFTQAVTTELRKYNLLLPRASGKIFLRLSTIWWRVSVCLTSTTDGRRAVTRFMLWLSYSIGSHWVGGYIWPSDEEKNSALFGNRTTAIQPTANHFTDW